MEYTNIAEIKAEVLLNHLYPELTDRWIVEIRGLSIGITAKT